jgi:alkylation response protein AidB-like acyl-CoA dehydrogenase
VVAIEILGVAGSLTAEERGDQRDEIEAAWYWAPCFRIAGGADEILRNILAERVLGLPGDIRVDRDIPFNQIKA